MCWGWGRWGGGCHSRVGALAASLPGCLSVSSASLPPYTLSHFSPMSLPNQGGGDEKERGKRGEESQQRERRRDDNIWAKTKECKGDPREHIMHVFTLLLFTASARMHS